MKSLIKKGKNKVITIGKSFIIKKHKFFLFKNKLNVKFLERKKLLKTNFISIRKKEKIKSISLKSCMFLEKRFFYLKNVIRDFSLIKWSTANLICTKWFKNKVFIYFNRELPRRFFIQLTYFFFSNSDILRLQQLIRKSKKSNRNYITPLIRQIIAKKRYYFLKKDSQKKRLILSNKFLKQRKKGFGIGSQNKNFLDAVKKEFFNVSQISNKQISGFSRQTKLFSVENVVIDHKVGVFRFKDEFLIRVLLEFLYKSIRSYKRIRRIFSSKDQSRFLKNRASRYLLNANERLLFLKWGFRPGLKPFQKLAFWRQFRKLLKEADLFSNKFIFFNSAKKSHFENLALFLDIPIESLEQITYEELFCRYLFQIMRYHHSIYSNKLATFTVLLSSLWGYIPRLFFAQKGLKRFLTYSFYYKKKRLYKKHFPFFFSMKKRFSLIKRKRPIFYLKFIFTINNIFCLIRNIKGEVLVKMSAGMYYRGSKKLSKFSLERLTQRFIRLCLKRVFKRVKKRPRVIFLFEGFSKQKKMLKSVLIILRRFKRFFKINRFDFFRKIAHNGIRGKKIRRV